MDAGRRLPDADTAGRPASRAARLAGTAHGRPDGPVRAFRGIRERDAVDDGAEGHGHAHQPDGPRRPRSDGRARSRRPAGGTVAAARRAGHLLRAARADHRRPAARPLAEPHRGRSRHPQAAGTDRQHEHVGRALRRGGRGAAGPVLEGARSADPAALRAAHDPAGDAAADAGRAARGARGRQSHGDLRGRSGSLDRHAGCPAQGAAWRRRQARPAVRHHRVHAGGRRDHAHRRRTSATDRLDRRAGPAARRHARGERGEGPARWSTTSSCASPG